VLFQARKIGKEKMRQRSKTALAFAFFLTALSPGASFSQTTGRNAGKDFNSYSPEKEAELGQRLAREVERSSRLVEDPSVTDYLNRLAAKIAQNSDAHFPITVRVIDSDAVDTLTLPGGLQYLNKGLILKTESEAELAGVMSYGIALTVLRASTRYATRGEMMQLAAMPLMLFGPGGSAGYDLYQAASLAIPMTYFKFHRDTVLAADALSLKYLYKSGYDPESVPRLFERVWPQVSAASKSIPKVFSLYPPLPDRVNAMRAELKKNFQHAVSRLSPPQNLKPQGAGSVLVRRQIMPVLNRYSEKSRMPTISKFSILVS
jgi:beta-barrel assembly-enhancing protease